MNNQRSKFPTPIIETLNAIRLGDYVKAESNIDALQALGKRNDPGFDFKNDCDALTARALVAEIDYYFGRYDLRAAELFKDASMVLVSIQGVLPDNAAKDKAPDYPRILRARCWYLLQYAIYRYRDGDYARARSYIEQATAIVESITVPNDNESNRRFNGTLAQLYFWQGNLGRQQQDYSRAISFYQKAMEHNQANLLAHKQNPTHVSSCLFRLGNILAMGFGWSHLRAGDLVAAKSCLLAAQTLMETAAGKNRLRQGHARLLLGAVYRAEAGTLRDKAELLDRAVNLLDEARKDIEGLAADGNLAGDKMHNLYLARVYYELAVAQANYVQPDRLRQAQEQAERAIQFAEKCSDAEYWCLAYVIYSRIERKLVEKNPGERDLERLETALYRATMAGVRAKETQQALPLFEARIEQGEACFAIAHFCLGQSRREDALKHFEAALARFHDARRLGVHPRHAAICSLHLARTYARMGQSGRAWQFFKDYERHSSGVQNGFIRDFAEQVHEELRKSFLVLDPQRVGEGEKVYEIFEHKLREYLVDWVQKSGNKEDAIQKLGVSRQTFFNWQKAEKEAVAKNPLAKVHSAAAGADS